MIYPMMGLLGQFLTIVFRFYKSYIWIKHKEPVIKDTSMNHYQITWLEQFLRPAVHFLTPLWPVIRPLLRLAFALTAATVAFQLTAEEGLGIWLALGAGLMSWNFLFKAPPGFANAVEDIGYIQSVKEAADQQTDPKKDWFYKDPAHTDCPTNVWHNSLDD